MEREAEHLPGINGEEFAEKVIRDLGHSDLSEKEKSLFPIRRQSESTLAPDCA